MVFLVTRSHLVAASIIPPIPDSDTRIRNGETILAFGYVLRPISMPDDIADLISDWSAVYQSPTLSPHPSLYDTPDKTWGHTPEGSYRAATHWNFRGPPAHRIPGVLHCPTHEPMRYGDNFWSIGRFVDGAYDILHSSPMTAKTKRRGITGNLKRLQHGVSGV